MKCFLRRLWLTLQDWIRFEGTFVAAAVSFYAALAVFPLLLVLISIFGWLLANSAYLQDWEAWLLDFVAQESSSQFAHQLDVQLSNIESGAIVSGPIGMLTLLILSVALFVNLERAFNRIWRIPREPAGIFVNLKRILFYRFRAFLMLLGIVLVVAMNFVANLAFEMASKILSDWIVSEHVWRLANLAASFLLNSLMFTAVFQTIPKHPVDWRHAIQGGVLTSVLWELGRFLLASMVISDRYTAFGVVGVFLAVLLWLYYGMIVVLFGATFVRTAGVEKENHSEGEDGS